MHSLFEGVSTHLLNQLFHHLIDDGIITLEEVNSEVKKLCSGYSDVDTMPAPVYRDGGSQSKFHFKQKGMCVSLSGTMFLIHSTCSTNSPYVIVLSTASQMKTLVRYLPLAIGDKVSDEDEHWTCFLTFWEICNVALAFEVRQEDAVHLGWLVQIFLEMFQSLYCEQQVTITPKMHHLVHLPDQMLRYVCC